MSVLQIASVDDVSYCESNTMTVQTTIRQMRTKLAAGRDDIPPKCLKALALWLLKGLEIY